MSGSKGEVLNDRIKITDREDVPDGAIKAIVVVDVLRAGSGGDPTGQSGVKVRRNGALKVDVNNSLPRAVNTKQNLAFVDPLLRPDIGVRSRACTDGNISRIRSKTDIILDTETRLDIAKIKRERIISPRQTGESGRRPSLNLNETTSLEKSRLCGRSIPALKNHGQHRCTSDDLV